MVWKEERKAKIRDGTNKFKQVRTTILSRARGQTAKFETLGYPQVSHTVYNVWQTW